MGQACKVCRAWEAYADVGQFPRARSDRATPRGSERFYSCEMFMIESRSEKKEDGLRSRLTGARRGAEPEREKAQAQGRRPEPARARGRRPEREKARALGRRPEAAQARGRRPWSPLTEARSPSLRECHHSPFALLVFRAGWGSLAPRRESATELLLH